MCRYRELHEMWLFIWNRLLGKLLWREVLNEFGHFMQMQITGNGRSNRILHVNHAREPHLNPDSSHGTHNFSKKMIKIPLENPCTWVTTFSIVKSVTNTFISWHEKTKKENKKQPVGILFLLNGCCKQAAAGMIRVFPIHFVPLQSNSTQCNIHDSHVATENCMKCRISYETHFLATFYTISYTNTTWNLLMEKRLIRMLHVNRVREPHINLDSFTFQPVSQRKWSKFHLKIPARESQHCLQSNLSQIHSYNGMKRPKKKTKSNLWEFCFSTIAVVSKLLLGWSGHFLFILCHCNPTVYSLTYVIHMQLQRTAWDVAFHQMKQIVGGNCCELRLFKETNLKPV